MGLKNRAFLSFPLLAMGLAAAGCAGFTQVERKMYMAAARLESNPVYEGRLTSSKRVGAMVALAFDDGKFFDVEDAPASLVAGDILRIYKSEQGYTAHLWRGAEDPLSSNDLNAPAAPQRGS